MDSLFPIAPRSETQMMAESFRILDGAVAEHRGDRLFLLFSGGTDSRAALAVTRRYAEARGLPVEVVHINTGIGVAQTNQFVRDTCQREGLTLHELTPPGKQYDDLVLQYGFPGPSSHRYMYVYLKERALRKFMRENKRSRDDRFLFVTGVRKAESRRRMGTVQETSREGSRVWVAPLLNFSKEHCLSVAAEANLPINPVSEKLGMSGECLCGAYADPAERLRIAEYFPLEMARIEALEDRAHTAGVHDTWDTAPKAPCVYGIREAQGQGAMEMCSSCEWRQGWQEIRQELRPEAIK